MDHTANIWKGVTSRIAELLPECDVKRSYNPEESLEALQGKERPLVTVAMGGRDSRICARDTAEDVYHFAAVIQKVLTTSDVQELDDLLPLLTRIQNGFYLESLTCRDDAGNETQIKLLSAEQDGFLDSSYFTTSEMFVAVCTLEAVHYRKTN